jgi:hypothetical protein
MYAIWLICRQEEYRAAIVGGVRDMTTRIGQAAQEVTQMNPWWRTPLWQDRDSDLRAVKPGKLNGYRPGSSRTCSPSSTATRSRPAV